MTPTSLREISAGGVLVRSSGGRNEVCLILRGRHGRKAWCLPKGHVEPGETAEAAALREVAEETGHAAEKVELLGTITYHYMPEARPGVVSKTVSFFLMRLVGETQRPPDPTEVMEVRWMSFEEALTCTSYDNERRILKCAQQAVARPRDSST